MKRTRKNIGQILDLSLAWHGNPSRDEIQSVVNRVRETLRLKESVEFDDGSKHGPSRPKSQVWRLAAVAAVVIVLSASLVRNLQWHLRAPAQIETADTGLQRLVDDAYRDVRVGDRIEFGEALRSNRGSASSFVLKDGSRVELRAKSELVLELAADGVRIRLNEGSVIVTAAKQRNGHLYVQTPDLTVSVVGTVFVVNAEEAGSRVAVIQGEVHVQQGETSQSLLPGEEVTTGLSMESQPMNREISWSRHAGEHLALLQQSSATVGTDTAGRAPSELKFDVTSVRPSIPIAGVERGGIRIGPNRFNATNITLRDLIVRAYGVKSYQISGGPGWVVSNQERYDVEAVSSEPVSQDHLLVMLQALLADRFKLELRRETTQISVYGLRTGKDPLKLIESSGDDSPGNSVSFSMSGPKMRLTGRNAPVSQLALWLTSVLLRSGSPVLDQTELGGTYNFQLEWLPEDSQPDIAAPGLFAAVREQLGLELKATKESVETLLIVHADRPSEN